MSAENLATTLDRIAAEIEGIDREYSAQAVAEQEQKGLNTASYVGPAQRTCPTPRDARATCGVRA